MALTRKVLACAMILALGLGLATSASAATYTEITASPFFDGGAGPEPVGPGIDRIDGVINGSDNGDLFKVVFTTGGTLVVLGRLKPGSGSLNPSLFLFDETGAGILADNDSGPLDDARIEVAIAAGTYYIGFGDDPLQAIDTDGSIWEGNSAVNSGPPAAFGILNRLLNDGVIISPGEYSITLSIPTGDPDGSAVPEPLTVGLLGAGLLGLGIAARRRRS